MLIQRATFARLCLARDRLHALNDAPTVHALALELGLSPFHFIRQFQALFGVTPHQLRIAARIERAKLLLARDEAVTAVCLEVGFSSLGSFSSSFARRVGASPSAYRAAAQRVYQAPGLSVPHSCLGMLAQLPLAAFAISEKRGAP
jgi:AraC-like DNA-binding protein